MFTISTLQTTLTYISDWLVSIFEFMDQIYLVDLGSMGYYTLWNFCQSLIILDIIAILWWLFRGYDTL